MIIRDEYTERKLSQIPDMPIFAVRIEYENLKGRIELGFFNEEDYKDLLSAYEERLK